MSADELYEAFAAGARAALADEYILFAEAYRNWQLSRADNDECS